MQKVHTASNPNLALFLIIYFIILFFTAYYLSGTSLKHYMLTWFIDSVWLNFQGNEKILPQPHLLVFNFDFDSTIPPSMYADFLYFKFRNPPLTTNLPSTCYYKSAVIYRI